jgi:cell division protein FtsA
MSHRQDNLIVALDVGSSWTRVLAAELVDNALRYCGHGMTPSAGMRRGLIAELGPAAKAVRAALDLAEFTSGRYVGDCAVGVGGPHCRGLNTNGGIELGGRMREIDAEDVRSAVERARAVERPPDREILHLLPRQFILDEQPGIFDPVGMVGKRLEVDLHIATCSGSALQSTITCANRGGLEVTETILESIAAAEATLTADERELGVCLVDIGCHSSDLVVFFEGAVVHTGSIAIGGQHFTNDLAVGLQTTVPQAEELKRRYGNVVVTDVPQHEEIEIGSCIVRRRRIAEILEARACELMQFVKENLRQNGVLDALGAGCVLTGGGSQLPGMLDVTENQLHARARAALPVRLSQMPAELLDPGFSVAVGMILYAHRTRMKRAAEKPSLASKVRAVFAGSF